ncbi:hypothetical protein GCM10010116_60390 [Microbispora rosea subsp. aerata]|nr:hypothetical protein GCM10010116_60390 [Microbispora rosea subsp. aerata]GLJ87335.1 hypothetical protein GCM10017588_60800 [Microbispora rosea subsp. aerata]
MGHDSGRAASIYQHARRGTPMLDEILMHCLNAIAQKGVVPGVGTYLGSRCSGRKILIVFEGKNRAAGLECMSCSRDTVVIEEMVKPGAPYSPPKYRAIHWWPKPGADDLDPDVPNDLASAYGEGVRALSVRAPRAAVVMFRGMLAFLVQDKGSQEAKNVFEKGYSAG